jgi:spore germination protein YaaH
MSKQTRIKIIIGAVLLAIIAVALLLMWKNKEDAENLEYVKAEYMIPEGEAMLILETEVSESNVLKRGESLYLPYSIASMLNDGFYDDEDEDDKTLTYVLPGEIIRITPDQKYYMSNDERIYTGDPVFIKENDTDYMDLAFLAKLSDMTYEYLTGPDRVIIHYDWKDYLFYEMKNEAPVHVRPDAMSGITMKLPEGEKVYYIGGYGNNKNDFVKIMTKQGLFGYVQRKHMGGSEHIYQESTFVEPQEDHILYDEKIKLGWWYVASTGGNLTYDECTRNAKAMNVLSPTWISLADDEGNIKSFADIKYVGRAHDDGFKVWIMVDFPDGEVSPHQNLSRNFARDRLIKNLIDETLSVGADGINIDFEALSVQTGVHFVQFIKELSVRCHLAGLVLSVDNLVPTAYTAHYDVESQAKFADYIVLMSYDEHYAASKEAGSVASIGFVRDAVTKTAKYCERSRIVMGLPFYTRLWKNSSAGLTSEVLSINAQEKYISKNDLKKSWDETTCQNIIDFTADNIHYTMWCEDVSSITYKCADAVSGNLGGVACWRLSLETPEIWTIIDQYIK